MIGLGVAGAETVRRFARQKGAQATEPIAAPTPPATSTPSPTPSATVPGRPVTGFDTVILGGRVMDPETRFDEIANVGIKDGVVTAISGRSLVGRKTIDAGNLVVAPGFIDNLTYEPTEFGVWYKLADGVTANIGMHGFDGHSRSFFTAARRRRWPLHYGGAFDDPWFRSSIGLGASGRPNSSHIKRLADMADQEIKGGWIGVDFEPEYSPGTAYDEILAISKVAARHEMPAYFHVRYADDQSPGTEEQAVEEVLRIAREADVAVHIDHINSTGGTFTMDNSLAMLKRANDQGIDATACTYPYNFWSTFAGSARFSSGWQERFHISYEDLEVPGTGERLTEASFKRYRAQNKVIIAYAIPEKSVVSALRSPHVMMGSDTILVASSGRHPRGAGAFSKMLGHYVREEKIVSLMDGLAKMTIMPAKKIERGAPAMRKKGRLQEGMDADITIFDPKTVIDRATVRRPAQYSKGIQWVLVLGHIVKDPKGLNKSVRFGKPILSAAALGSG